MPSDTQPGPAHIPIPSQWQLPLQPSVSGRFTMVQLPFTHTAFWHSLMGGEHSMSP